MGGGGVGAGVGAGVGVGGRGGDVAPGSSQQPVAGFKWSEEKNNVRFARGRLTETHFHPISQQQEPNFLMLCQTLIWEHTQSSKKGSCTTLIPPAMAIRSTGKMTIRRMVFPLKKGNKRRAS